MGIARAALSNILTGLVLLGALVGALGLTEIDWKEIIAKTVKPAFADVNIKAFDAGLAAV